jgi:hypothetical protein
VGHGVSRKNGAEATKEEMKDQWEQECAALRAEVVALQQQVRALVAPQARAKPLARWRVSKSMRLGLLTVCVLLAAAGVLYGAGAMEALFIDQDGKVGIGTTNPTSALHVAGDKSVRFELGPAQKLSLGGNGAFEVDAPYIFGGRFIVTEDGKVGIGRQKPETTLDVAGGIKATSIAVRGRAQAQSLAFINEKGEEYQHNWIGMADNVDGDTKWLHIGGITDGADNNKQRRIALYANTTYIDGNVGIWTKQPKARLDVNGDIKATSVNGEKPPMVFEVGQKDDTKNWHHVEHDIGALCGDADGCTMKFFLRHSLNDQVRTISEQIYIEQPDKSNNKQAGLHGWTRQLGGGDSEFVLQTNALHEIIPHPWDWIYVRNYSSPEVGPKSTAFGSYKVQFLTHPHVTATVIIYDR